MDYNGAQIIAGTPHCGIPDHLITIERPGKGATQRQVDDFITQVQERQKDAMFRNKTPWQNGDGKTRWRCAAKTGTVGCPQLEGSVEAALKYNLPIVNPPESELAWCKTDTASIESGPHMKYQQQEYWGLPYWLVSWNRRPYVEGSFGNIKNHNTGNVHRGFMCFTGMPLVTLAVTAAVVAYNLREAGELVRPRHRRRTAERPPDGLRRAPPAPGHPVAKRLLNAHRRAGRRPRRAVRRFASDRYPRAAEAA